MYVRNINIGIKIVEKEVKAFIYFFYNNNEKKIFFQKKKQLGIEDISLFGP